MRIERPARGPRWPQQPAFGEAVNGGRVYPEDFRCFDSAIGQARAVWRSGFWRIHVAPRIVLSIQYVRGQGSLRMSLDFIFIPHSTFRPFQADTFTQRSKCLFIVRHFLTKDTF